MSIGPWNPGPLRLGMAVLSAYALLGGASVSAQPFDGCPSKEIIARFDDFGRTGKMPPDLGRWLNDPKAQYIEPYQAFDNVYFVGVCWVSAWLIKTSEGVVLIDTLHEPHVDQLIANIRKVGVDPADIKYVLMTHGHFDHVGGAYKLKPMTKARFVMTQTGWDEAIKSAQASQAAPRPPPGPNAPPPPWQMIEQDKVVKDGDVIGMGDNAFEVFATPGHTFGTASYAYKARDGVSTYNAFTVGGLGLNAIENSRQVEAYIASVKRIEQLVKQPTDPINVHLTTHPFSTGLTEAKDAIRTRKPGAMHPLVDPAGFAKQLAELRRGAEERLVIEQKAGR